MEHDSRRGLSSKQIARLQKAAEVYRDSLENYRRAMHFVCKHCGDSFDNFADYNEHVEEFKGLGYCFHRPYVMHFACDHCGGDFNEYWKYCTHMQESGHYNKCLDVYIAGKKSTSKSARTSNKYESDDEDELSCWGECKDSFGNYQHKLCASDAGNFICEHCGETFDNECWYAEHDGDCPKRPRGRHEDCWRFRSGIECIVHICFRSHGGCGKRFKHCRGMENHPCVANARDKDEFVNKMNDLFRRGMTDIPPKKGRPPKALQEKSSNKIVKKTRRSVKSRKAAESLSEAELVFSSMETMKRPSNDLGCFLLRLAKDHAEST